ncbi:hypothetical protein ACIBEF_32015, partial [Micromonospora sp. NPDC050795]|uniref:hypothetical protein n=1 Tax=Micromonospora sp. NPDC050795 TaxID=3364282 RepID=UPI0037AC87DD
RCDHTTYPPNNIDIRSYAADSTTTSIMPMSCRNARSGNCGWSTKSSTTPMPAVDQAGQSATPRPLPWVPPSPQARAGGLSIQRGLH